MNTKCLKPMLIRRPRKELAVPVAAGRQASFHNDVKMRCMTLHSREREREGDTAHSVGT